MARAIAWAASRFPDTPHEPYWGDWYNAVIHEQDGEIIAAVIYNNLYPGNSLDMHVTAIPGRNWLTRQFLNVVFSYPFVQLGLRRATAKVGENNKAAVRFLKHLGFKHEGTHPEGWDSGVALLSFGLLKNECRFLGKING